MSRDVAASIRQRLLNEAKRQDRPFQELLPYFAMERFLYRLGPHLLADCFVLNGALLLTAWQITQSRPTADIDLSGRTSNDQDYIRRWVEELCVLAVENDGIVFDLGSPSVPLKFCEVRKMPTTKGFGSGSRRRWLAPECRCKSISALGM